MMMQILLLALVPYLVAANSKWIQRDTIPSTGQGDWISLKPGVEFQPAFEGASERVLATSDEAQLPGYSLQFMDGQETLYNDYAQAWRLLGMYIDCNYVYSQREYRARSRGLEDQATYQGYHANQACQRMVLWAAYVDIDYEGGGIGEYQYYDRQNGVWDTSSCEATGNTRCARMDCHLPDTHFKLLGYFKEPGYDQWMEQLFKHEGICVWTDEEYEFMQNDRQAWPVNCIATDSVDEDGNTLFFHTKPLPQGRMGVGLYTDWRCSQDYLGEEYTAAQVLAEVDDDNYRNDNEDSGDYDGNIYQLEEQLDAWNDAIDVFKVCQPCVAYNLGYIPEGDFNDREGQDEDGNYFACYDDADYTNVNQCMKFRTHTDMLTATFQDVHMASQQGSIVEVEILGITYGSGGFNDVNVDQTVGTTDYKSTSQETNRRGNGDGFLGVSVCILALGMFAFGLTVYLARKGQMREPLLKKTGFMA